MTKTIVTTWKDVQAKFKTYISNPKDITAINKAFQLANKYHQGQKRRSKEPYINHIVETLSILCDIKANKSALVIGALHDTLEDTKLKEDVIENEFGPYVKDAIKSLTKVRDLTESKKSETLNYNYIQQIIVGMLGDPNVIIVKLADRIHNMRTLNFLPPKKRIKIANETRNVFVPIAHRLAIHNFKSELEDLCFLHLEPKEYIKIKELVKSDFSRSSNIIEETIKNLKKILKKKNIKDFQIYGRKKHLYSIYKKMNLGKKYYEILDLFAIRIIPKTKEECYRILGIVHENYQPIPTKLKDFITMPKQNLYQALHTTVITNKTTIEIQIRSNKMEDIANFGVASHYLYKKNDKDDNVILSENIAFFNVIQKYVDAFNIIKDKKNEIVKNTIYDLFKIDVQVLTPAGEIVSLPHNSSALDFAFKLHTKLGIEAVDAIINGKNSPLNTIVKSGDLVEIITKPGSILEPEAMNWVHTKYALDIIKKNYKKMHQLDEKVDENFGKQIINSYIVRHPEYKDIITNPKNIERAIKNLKFNSSLEMYQALIEKKIIINDIINAAYGGIFKKRGGDIQNKNKSNQRIIVKENQLLNDLNIPKAINKEKLVFSLCENCNPIFGENINAEILLSKTKTTKGKMIVHRENCSVIMKKRNKLMVIDWKKNHPSNGKYITHLNIYVINRPNILRDVIELFSYQNLNILKLEGSELTSDENYGLIKVIFKVYDIEQLANLFQVFKDSNIIHDIIRK